MRNLDFIQSGKVATESPWRFKQSLPFDGENADSFEDLRVARCPSWISFRSLR